MKQTEYSEDIIGNEHVIERHKRMSVIKEQKNNGKARMLAFKGFLFSSDNIYAILTLVKEKQ